MKAGMSSPRKRPDAADVRLSASAARTTAAAVYGVRSPAGKLRRPRGRRCRSSSAPSSWRWACAQREQLERRGLVADGEVGERALAGLGRGHPRAVARRSARPCPSITNVLHARRRAGARPRRRRARRRAPGSTSPSPSGPSARTRRARARMTCGEPFAAASSQSGRSSPSVLGQRDRAAQRCGRSTTSR